MSKPLKFYTRNPGFECRGVYPKENPFEDMVYGMREFGIRDGNGDILNLGQNIE